MALNILSLITKIVSSGDLINAAGRVITSYNKFKADKSKTEQKVIELSEILGDQIELNKKLQENIKVLGQSVIELNKRIRIILIITSIVIFLLTFIVILVFIRK